MDTTIGYGSHDSIEQAIRRYQEGEQGGLYAVVECCLNRIYSYALKHTSSRHDADDLTQDVLLELCISLHQLRHPEAFWGWLASLERHVLGKWYAKKNRDATMTSTFDEWVCAGTEHPVEDEAEYVEQLAWIRAAVSRLSSIHREVLVRFYVHEKTIDQIALECNVPVGTIKRRLHNARMLVKQQMRGRNPTVQNNLGVPRKLWVTVNGSYNVQAPYRMFERLLPQNLALAAYHKPLTEVELSGILGVNRAYVEEELSTLVKGEALKKVSYGYQTDFIIMESQQAALAEALMSKEVPELAVVAVTAIRDKEKQVRAVTPSMEIIDDEGLLWLFIPSMMHQAIEEAIHQTQKVNPPISRSDGGYWYLNGWEGEQSQYRWLFGTSTSVHKDLGMGSSVFWSNEIGFRAGNLSRQELLAVVAVARGDDSIDRLSTSLGKDNDTEELIGQMAAKGFLKVANKAIHLGIPVLLGEEKQQMARLVSALATNLIDHVTALEGLVADQLLPSIPQHLAKQFPSFIAVVMHMVTGLVFKELEKQQMIRLPLEPKSSVQGIFAWSDNR